MLRTTTTLLALILATAVSACGAASTAPDAPEVALAFAGGVLTVENLPADGSASVTLRYPGPLPCDYHYNFDERTAAGEIVQYNGTSWDVILTAAPGYTTQVIETFAGSVVFRHPDRVVIQTADAATEFCLSWACGGAPDAPIRL